MNLRKDHYESFELAPSEHCNTRVVVGVAAAAALGCRSVGRIPRRRRCRPLPVSPDFGGSVRQGFPLQWEIILLPVLANGITTERRRVPAASAADPAAAAAAFRLFYTEANAKAPAAAAACSLRRRRLRNCAVSHQGGIGAGSRTPRLKRGRWAWQSVGEKGGGSITSLAVVWHWLPSHSFGHLIHGWCGTHGATTYLVRVPPPPRQCYRCLCRSSPCLGCNPKGCLVTTAAVCARVVAFGCLCLCCWPLYYPSLLTRSLPSTRYNDGSSCYSSSSE